MMFIVVVSDLPVPTLTQNGPDIIWKIEMYIAAKWEQYNVQLLSIFLMQFRNIYLVSFLHFRHRVYSGQLRKISYQIY